MWELAVLMATTQDNKQIEWSARHTRLSYQTVVFGFIFLMLVIFEPSIKFPFMDFKVDASLQVGSSEKLVQKKPSLLFLKVTFLSLWIWFAFAFWFQSRREQLRKFETIEKLDAELKKLKETQDLIRGDIANFKNSSLQHVLDRSFTAEQCQSVIEDYRRVLDGLITAYAKISDELKTELKKQTKAIRSANRFIDFYFTKLIIAMPLVLSTLCVFAGLIFWKFGVPKCLGWMTTINDANLTGIPRI